MEEGKISNQVIRALTMYPYLPVPSQEELRGWLISLLQDPTKELRIDLDRRANLLNVIVSTDGDELWRKA